MARVLRLPGTLCAEVSDGARLGYVYSYARVGNLIEIELHFTPEPASVSEARHALDEIQELVPQETLDDLRIMVSELVTNSVRHAGLRIRDLITLNVSFPAEAVRVEVVDAGPGFDPPPTKDPEWDEPGGHGLYLIHTLSDRWSVERKDGLSQVWFEVGLEPDTV